MPRLAAPHLALLAVSLIYGLFYVAVKIVTQHADAWDIFSLRVMGASPILFLLERFFIRSPWPNLKDWLKITGLGLLGISFVQWSIVTGVKYTSVFHTSLIIGLSPITALLLSWAIGQETMSKTKVVGMTIAFMGLFFLLSAKQGTAVSSSMASTFYGDGLLLINVAVWTVFLALSKIMIKRFHPLSLTAWAFSTSTLVTLPGLIYGLHGHWPGASLPLVDWGWMAFIVLMGTVTSYFLYFYSLSKLPASTVAVYVYLQPIITSSFGFLLLREHITPIMALNALIIIVGVAIANMPAISLKPTETNPIPEQV